MDFIFTYEEFLEGLAHEGVAHDKNPPGRGSGRYPYGSGNRIHQHEWDLQTRIEDAERKYLDGKTINPKTNKPYTTRDIAEMFGYRSTTQLKAQKQINSNAIKMDEGAEINWYKHQVNPDTGKVYGDSEIGRILGMNESSVRSKYKTYIKGNVNKVTDTANKLKDNLKEKGGFIDIGHGTEIGLEVSPDRLNTAAEMLQQEGYEVLTIPMRQVTGGSKMTTYKLLCPPGTTKNDIWEHKDEIRLFDPINKNESATNTKGLDKPIPIDLKQVAIKYDENGGTSRDGLVEIKGHKDKDGNWVADNPMLSLGNARYAQVRIAVNGDKECVTEDNPTGMKYIKGMAAYSDDIPDGKDLLVWSNKSAKDGPKKALKDMEPESDFPFGSSVVQTKGKDGKPLSINMVGTYEKDMHKEGTWGTWSKNLPSQFLGKQNLALAKQQLKLKARQSEDEYNDILKLNNSVVKKNALLNFSDQCDNDAVNLKAAPIGGQGTKVLMPIPSLKDKECYCPSLENGTTVALVRFPHAGPFEIPICTVNNNNRAARKQLGDGRDCVGINHTVAAKLSGADFDGDTAIVIPMTKKNANGEFVSSTRIKSAPSLPGLAGFDPTGSYGQQNYPGKKYHIMTKKEKGLEMGKASNLITDMYAKGCDDPEELSRAVQYSMVVIDAKKHKLNYKQAYEDYNIQELKDKYQKHINPATGKVSYGANSLLSKAKSDVDVPVRQQNYSIDKETGEKIWRKPQVTTEANRQKVKVAAPEGYKQLGKDGKLHSYKFLKDAEGKDVYATEDGKLVKNKDGSYSYDRGSNQIKYETKGYKQKMQKSTKMYEAKNAEELLSANPNEIEKAYADYANHMKTMANRARKEAVNIQSYKRDPEAVKKYSAEVASLGEKLKKAKAAAPIERQAQLYATSLRNAEYNDNPDWDEDDKKKAKARCLNVARERCGVTKHQVTFTEKEWEAVNAHAISPSQLNELLKNADTDNYMQLAMPRQDRISDTKKNRILALYNAGWSYEQIKRSVSGVSLSSIANIIGEKKH